ncbi:hypothetical protein [Thermodesulfatator autotrophicus]|uniref:Uncharacterized protein n=1 Tax=Thermodesulfatator autotrophicus TaxID=1795632 RepID=A0A177EA87_9BACT|nr:hypothetical protein [Thermodesulfatator autotrophicus]OAG28340.1 hypothetical protein TH606_02445 [Thermodesulfatator autotrophicus]
MAFDDERERPTWREIDKMRDRSPHTRHRKDETALESALKDKWMKERYLKEVEKLFAGKKGTPEHDKALSRIHKSYGTNRFNKAVRDYVKEYGLPEDWGTLILLLDHRDVEIVCGAMKALKELYPAKGPVEKQGFLSKMRVLSMTAKSEKVQEEAMALLDELGM